MPEGGHQVQVRACMCIKHSLWINIITERRQFMAVTIKSEHEIELMREAGRILSIVHDEMAR